MIRATHELHDRRKGMNMGVGLCLVALVVVIMGLTYVKITNGTFAEKPDHVLRPAIVPPGEGGTN